MLSDIHRLKTAALIAVSIEGAAKIADCPDEQGLALKKYGALIGEAFQVADDILDHEPSNPEASSYVSVHGLKKAKEHLEKLTEACLAQAQIVDSLEFSELAKYNKQRTH